MISPMPLEVIYRLFDRRDGEDEKKGNPGGHWGDGCENGNELETGNEQKVLVHKSTTYFNCIKSNFTKQSSR